MRFQPDPPYLPTREQIEAGCREIQATWSPEVESERRVGSHPAAVPVYRVRNGRRDQVLVETVQ